MSNPSNYNSAGEPASPSTGQPVSLPKTPVSIVRAGRYDLNEITTAIEKGLGLIGGLEGIIKPGDRVFVKINHLPPPSPPERGIVTHPVFVEAVVNILKETGAVITVGDDISVSPHDGFSVSGIQQMCQRADVTLLSLRETGFITTQCGGRLLDTVYLARTALEADVVVNLPKLKTHSLTLFTGAVKNMYGIIPSNLRSQYHGRYPDPADFGLMLTDIYSALRPQLNIMDGIMAMEGEGPANGQLRELGIVLASRDGVALDAVAGSVIGLRPEDIDTTRYADERGLGTGKLTGIDVLGESIESVAASDFKLPSTASRTIIRRLPPGIMDFLFNQRSVRPQVAETRCTACEECINICPTGAAALYDKTARINRKACIRCLCCHEVCRYDAILLQRPITGRIIDLAFALARKILRRYA